MTVRLIEPDSEPGKLLVCASVRDFPLEARGGELLAKSTVEYDQSN